MVSQAARNSQSASRLDKMVRITASTQLSTFRDNIVDGTALVVVAPNGTEDGQKLSWTWKFGSSFTVTGLFSTSEGDDTELIVTVDLKPALILMVWNTALNKWEI